MGIDEVGIDKVGIDEVGINPASFLIWQTTNKAVSNHCVVQMISKHAK